MNANHSAAVLSHEYQPTLIETPLLIKRLVIQIAFFRNELQRRWIYCDRNPLAFGRWLVTNFGRRLLQCVSQPHFVSAVVTAFAVIACSVALLLLIGRAQSKPVENVLDTIGEPLDVVVMDLATPPTSASHVGLGKGGGSPQKPRAFGGGGNNDPHPPQAGKLPPPSLGSSRNTNKASHSSAITSGCRDQYRSNAVERPEGARLRRSGFEITNPVQRAGPGGRNWNGQRRWHWRN